LGEPLAKLAYFAFRSGPEGLFISSPCPQVMQQPMTQKTPFAQHREILILNYVEAYNSFNVDQMVKDLSPEIIFQHIENGDVTFFLKGKEEFHRQASKICDFYSERKQTILAFEHREMETSIQVDFFAILSKDLPNGLKKGEIISMKGESIFKFKEGMVLEIIDVV
jgi:hypothetical protein